VLAAPLLQPVTVLAGEGYLERILDNLIAAGGPGNHVSARVTIAQHRAWVVVSDDGPGMSQAEPGLPPLRGLRHGGSGLGLAIVHRLANSSRGSVSLSQTQGGGLTVAVDFPLADQARGAEQLGTPRA
jgi:signal transduction histidine kinase